MKRLMFTLSGALLFLAAAPLFAAENLIKVPLAEWKQDFRTPNPELYGVVAKDGVTEIKRLPGSIFGRIYYDCVLTPGKVYELSCDRLTERGALVKQLVIFKGNDNVWREKTRLSNYEPLVNGEWSKAVMTFEVPGDVKETRLDFRLDSYGVVMLKNMTLTELSPEAAAVWRKEVAVRPFQPGSEGDYILTPGAYYRITFCGAPAKGQTEGRLMLNFHSPEKDFVRDGSITFFCRDPRGREVSEIIVAADNVDGVRVKTENAEIGNLKFTEIKP